MKSMQAVHQSLKPAIPMTSIASRRISAPIRMQVALPVAKFRKENIHKRALIPVLRMTSSTRTTCREDHAHLTHSERRVDSGANSPTWTKSRVEAQQLLTLPAQTKQLGSEKDAQVALPQTPATIAKECIGTTTSSAIRENNLSLALAELDK